MNSNRDSSERNMYSILKNYSNLFKDDKTLAILFDIARKSPRNYKQLSEDLGFGPEIIEPSIERLKENGLIKPNPNLLSNKFKLSLNGGLLIEQLKVLSPNISEAIGSENLIKL